MSGTTPGLATELAPYGVAVNCLAPRKVVMTEGAVAGGVNVAPAMIEGPKAMGKAAVYLANQSAATLTGTVQYSLGPFAGPHRRTERPPHNGTRPVRPIKCGEEMIFPDEVEAVLRYHPAVADTAVTGLPHPTLGNYLVALVSGRAQPTSAQHRGGPRVLRRSAHRIREGAP